MGTLTSDLAFSAQFHYLSLETFYSDVPSSNYQGFFVEIMAFNRLRPRTNLNIWKSVSTTLLDKIHIIIQLVNLNTA